MSLPGTWGNTSRVPILYQFQYLGCTCHIPAQNQSWTKYQDQVGYESFFKKFSKTSTSAGMNILKSCPIPGPADMFKSWYETNTGSFSFGLVELWMREWGEVFDQVAFLWYLCKSHLFGSSITISIPSWSRSQKLFQALGSC